MYIRAAIPLVLFFMIDRTLKWLALHTFPREGLFIIPDATGLVLVRNQGIAYSIPMPMAALILVSLTLLAVLSALLIRAYRRQQTRIVIALGLVMIGAASNLVDRIQYEYVIDMLVLTGWPVFNLADVYILAGALWAGIIFVFHNKHAAE